MKNRQTCRDTEEHQVAKLAVPRNLPATAACEVPAIVPAQKSYYFAPENYKSMQLYLGELRRVPGLNTFITRTFDS